LLYFVTRKLSVSLCVFRAPDQRHDRRQFTASVAQHSYGADVTHVDAADG
jgi:hypothetical protein